MNSWFDADTIILNQNVPWEAFLPPSDLFPEINFLGNKDWFGYNCGVFFLRVNEWSINFLTEATGLPLLRPDVELGTRAPNYEQDAMVWVLEKEGYRDHVVYQPRQWYNPFEEGESHQSEYQRGDLLVHFPGMAKKHPAMGRWLDRVDHSPEELQIPTSNFTLKADITHFWTRLNNAKVLLDKVWDLQSKDKYKQLFTQNPKLGDALQEATDHLQKIYEETPYQAKEIREAYSRVDARIKSVQDASKKAQMKKAKAKSKLDTPEELTTGEKDTVPHRAKDKEEFEKQREELAKKKQDAESQKKGLETWAENEAEESDINRHD